MSVIVTVVWLYFLIGYVKFGQISWEMFLAMTIFCGCSMIAIQIEKLASNIKMFAEVTCGTIYGTTELLKKNMNKEETKNE